MQASIRIHNNILRRLLRSTGGYEVKTEGDAFSIQHDNVVVSFQSVTSAALWAMTVQLELLQADWPHEILDTEECKQIMQNESESTDGSDRIIYRGIRVRMG